MPTDALVSLAILKVNWDRLGHDYIENFVPFVAEALRLAPDDVVSLPVLQETVRTQFGFDIPLNPLRQILQRSAKRGLVRRQSGVFYRQVDRLNESNFGEIRGMVVSIHDRIVSRLRDFARAEQRIDWSEEQAATAVRSFLSDQGLRFLYAQAERTALPGGDLPKGAAYTVASFLAQSRRSDPQVVKDFTVLVKGHLLAGAIYHRDTGRVAQRFRNTSVYLDTSVVVFAAGYAGPERQAPCEELLRLLREYGAELRCFQFTVDEIQGILDACAARIRRGQLRDAFGPTIEWFLETGRTASDIELMIARLPSKLRSLGIAIEESPERMREFQVDEEGFDAELESRIGYRNPKARIHDVNCIAAIAQIRKGRHAFDVESCGAVFVTTNVELARAAREYFQAEAPEGAVALCTTDYSLGNLLWLKNPTRAPDLPEKLLLADVYAATQPPESLWKAYLAEIARLDEQGAISSDEYYTLRYSLAAKSTLMDITAGDVAAFSEGTVVDVLRVAKENIRADLETALQHERRKRESAESTASQLEQQEVARREHIAGRARGVARLVARAVCAVLLLVLILGAALSFPVSLPGLRVAWYRYLTTASLAIFFVYTIASILWGTSVMNVARRLESWAFPHVHRWLCRVSE